MPIKVVITGGPGTGKTSVINILRKKYPIMPESARAVLTNKHLFKSSNSVKNRGMKLQNAIWNLEAKHYKIASGSKRELAFFDRGYFDGFAYLKLSNLKNPKKAMDRGKNIKYDYIFMLNPLPIKFYGNDAVRPESYSESKKIHKLIINTYKKFGYKPINVPFDTVENRVKFILNHINVR